MAAIREVALAAGARDVVVSRHFADGGAGAEDLARAVWDAAAEGAPDFQLLYPDDLPLREKIETVAVRIYGARGVDELPAATKALKLYEELGYGNLPVCMAKTHLSLSHDPVAEGPAHRLPRPHPRGPSLGRRRLRHAAAGRDAHHAGPALAPRRRVDRHRRRRQHRGPVLGPGIHPC